MGNTMATYMETLKKIFLNEDSFISERGYDFSLKSRIRQAKRGGMAMLQISEQDYKSGFVIKVHLYNGK